MNETIELSEALVLKAREAAANAGRSTEDQIEFWVRLGRSAEPFLGADQAEALGNAPLAD
jgi:hypothetical protein